MTAQESHKECRRLQLIAMLPAEHQRLVKYPLMLETLAKQCEKNKTKSKKPDTPPNDKPDGDETEPNERKSSGSSQAPKSPSNEDDDDPAFVESTSIKKYVERTREIVGTVDKLVAEAQNIQRLAEIQQGLDVSGLDKFPDSPISIEYRVSCHLILFQIFINFIYTPLIRNILNTKYYFIVF